jgi:NCAIR mutase (PurE)-related protein
MDRQMLRQLLAEVQAGVLNIDEALHKLRQWPAESLGFATVDHHRALRCGFPEVIYCEGKTRDQIVAIVERLTDSQANVLGTRMSADQFDAVSQRFTQAEYHQQARCMTLRQQAADWSTGRVGIVCAGTTDLPVAEEARVTCEIMDQRVETIYDVGVAGLHRLLARSQELQSVNAVVAVAGMEGALPSVVGGLVEVPVIAVPTSIGYGASFGGLAALLTMLNSCAAGVSVVNIDNGFAGGYIAATINRLIDRGGPDASQQHGTQESDEKS